ncbi:acetolactate synthase catalytic subunit [Oceanobacillus oncorhynchi]|uniref:acetolactate synthase catalytic subunit n=1 Tax=Oceanobacillus oncorhynchi TaxID=545501 RepID=UPI0034D78DFA
MENHLKLTNAERFAQTLYKNGVRYIFGQSNPQTIMLASEAIGIKQIGFRQENAGAYMAQGYGMISQKVPVVAAQNGPAATLLVPGLAEALKSSHAMVAIVDDVPLSDEDRNAFQELDQVSLFQGVSKWTKKINSPARIEELVDRAFIEAASGKPGPVVLLCPKDIFYDTTKNEVTYSNEESYSSYPLDRPVSNIEQIKKAVELISKSSSPLIYAGGGVNTSGASDILKKIQEEFSIPVATTTMGKGTVDENHPLTIGPIGYYMGKRGRTKFLKEFVQESDLILLIGNRTNQNGTDTWSLLPKDATYIHIDIDHSEIGRNYSSLRLLGDAKATLDVLYYYLTTENYKNAAKNIAVEKIANARQKHKVEVNEIIEQKHTKLRIEQFMENINNVLDDDHIIVSDASFSSIWTANYIDAYNQRKFIFPRGLAGLGWGLPMAMGSKLAANKKVFCLSGDGGFAHVWSELETCNREGIDVVIAVINNTVLGYQKHAEVAKWGKHTSACILNQVDYVKIAEACDIKGIRIDSTDNLEEKLEEAMHHKGSVLIDLIIDPDCIPPLPFMEPLETV